MGKKLPAFVYYLGGCMDNILKKLEELIKPEMEKINILLDSIHSNQLPHLWPL